MFAFIAALAATLYIFFVSISALFTACAFNKSWTRQIAASIGRVRGLYFLADVGASFFTEFPLHLAALQYAATKFVQFFGGFRYTLPWLAYFVDMAIVAGLLVLFVESLQEKTVVEEAVKDLVGGDPTEPLDSIVSYQYFNRLLKPFWQSSDIIIYPNITYATSEEMTEAVELTKDYDQPRRMVLDVYTHAKAPKDIGLRPVLVHIHGGAWRMGKKDVLYPHEADLITQDNWIVVNIGYRLAPKNPYPTHLYDVKRALRWIKRTISVFGGDPNFVVVSGDSAGGHLAALAALTANDPKYQPGFEDVDTSVQGVITINGVLDLLHDGRAEYFTRQVAMQDKVDTEFLKKHSPRHLLSKVKEEGRLVPFFVISGERDSVVDLSVGVRFKEAYDEVIGDKAAGTQCTLLKLPGAHHVCHIMWSPRSLHIARIAQVWCRQLYNKRK